MLIVLYYYYYKYEESYENTKIRILHLVLYSNDKHYDCMQKITCKYYNRFPNVTTIYYKYNPILTTNYSLNTNILEIKGNETYIPGILDKTLDAIKYFKNDNYDYIVRSNISTIINFNLLNDNLNNIFYGGGLLNSLNEQLKNTNITPKPNSMYVSGTAIIFSNECVKLLLSNESLLNKTLVDDLAIGLLFHDLDIIPTCINNFIFVDDVNNIDTSKNIFYRNRSNDRNKDCENMDAIIKKLIL